MTDVEMTLVVRASDTQGNWKVGLFQPFKIEGDKLSTNMKYVDGNIGKCGEIRLSKMFNARTTTCVIVIGSYQLYFCHL